MYNSIANVKFCLVIYYFSIPQQRAVETATIVTGRAPIIDNRIDVFDVGSADRLNKLEVEYDGLFPDPKIYSGVENPQNYLKRVFSFLNSIKKDEEMNSKNILVCGHKCTAFAFACYFRGMPKDSFLNYYLRNGEVAVYNFENNLNRELPDSKTL